MAKASSKFLSTLQLEDLDGTHWKLLAPLVYQQRREVDGKAVKTRYVVSEGFVTDLASIPSFVFWRSKSGNYNEAAVLHDACYAGTVTVTPAPATPLTRGEADGLFKDAMKVLGVGWWTRTVLHRAVRLGGWKAWKTYRTAEQVSSE